MIYRNLIEIGDTKNGKTDRHLSEINDLEIQILCIKNTKFYFV